MAPLPSTTALFDAIGAGGEEAAAATAWRGRPSRAPPARSGDLPLVGRDAEWAALLRALGDAGPDGRVAVAGGGGRHRQDAPGRGRPRPRAGAGAPTLRPAASRRRPASPTPRWRRRCARAWPSGRTGLAAVPAHALAEAARLVPELAAGAPGPAAAAGPGRAGRRGAVPGRGLRGALRRPRGRPRRRRRRRRRACCSSTTCSGPTRPPCRLLGYLLRRLAGPPGPRAADLAPAARRQAAPRARRRRAHDGRPGAPAGAARAGARCRPRPLGAAAVGDERGGGRRARGPGPGGPGRAALRRDGGPAVPAASSTWPPSPRGRRAGADEACRCPRAPGAPPRPGPRARGRRPAGARHRGGARPLLRRRHAAGAAGPQRRGGGGRPRGAGRARAWSTRTPGTSTTSATRRSARSSTSDTSPARRRLLHRRAAAALAQPGPDREDRTALVARHLERAGRDDEAALAHARAAGRARAVYANADALAHLRAALVLGHPDRPALLTRRRGRADAPGRLRRRRRRATRRRRPRRPRRRSPVSSGAWARCTAGAASGTSPRPTCAPRSGRRPRRTGGARGTARRAEPHAPRARRRPRRPRARPARPRAGRRTGGDAGAVARALNILGVLGARRRGPRRRPRPPRAQRWPSPPRWGTGRRRRPR